MTVLTMTNNERATDLARRGWGFERLRDEIEAKLDAAEQRGAAHAYLDATDRNANGVERGAMTGDIEAMIAAIREVPRG